MDNPSNATLVQNLSLIAGQVYQGQPTESMKLTNEQKVVVDAMQANGETEELMLYVLVIGGNIAYQYGQFKKNKQILKRYIAGEADLEEK